MPVIKMCGSDIDDSFFAASWETASDGIVLAAAAAARNCRRLIRVFEEPLVEV